MKLPGGCYSFLLEFITCIVFTFIIPVAKSRPKCRHNERQCTNGVCIPDESVFMKCPDECNSNQKKCPDTSCVFLRDVCPNNCGPGYKQCRGGTCILRSKKCPGECERRQRECPDGSCTASYQGHCPGECRYHEKRCPNGTCIGESMRCRVQCKLNEKWCPGDSCVDSSRGKCPGERCPPHFPISCQGSQICYRKSEECDGKKHCPFGSDERDCRTSSGFWWGWYVLIPCSIAVVIIPFVVCFMCCKGKILREREPYSNVVFERVSRQAVENAQRRRREYAADFGHESRYGTCGQPEFPAPSAPPETDPEAYPEVPMEADPEAPPSYASVMASDQWVAPTAPSSLPYVDEPGPGTSEKV